MPLLRGKPFRPKIQPNGLKAEDEVFFFELTDEVFTDYDEFFERVILCNSLLWTCEGTGRSGLTYKEATESEESVRKALEAVPDATKRAVLLLVHQTKRSRIGDLCEEIMDYLKKRYQEGEIVEVKVKDQWKRAKIEKVHATSSENKLDGTPKKLVDEASPNKQENDTGVLTPKKKTPKKGGNDPQGLALSPKKNLADEFVYEVKPSKSEASSDVLQCKGKEMRRCRGVLTRDIIRLLLRQTCKRTTALSESGYWIVEPDFVAKYALGAAHISGPLSAETPLKLKNKRKRSSGKFNSNDDNLTPSKKRKSSDSNLASSSEGKKSKIPKGNVNQSDSGAKKQRKSLSTEQKEEQLREKLKNMTPARKKKFLEKQKLKEQAQKEKIKQKKLVEKEKEKERLKKEKEEEKQKRKFEREKERERTTEIRKLETEFLREWTRVRDDLLLEDLKELPEPQGLATKMQGDLFGDALMVVEFLNIFGAFYDIKDSFQQDITYGFVEAALHEHDAEGSFYDIVKFLLQTFFTISKEENEEDVNDDDSTNGTNTPDEPEMELEQYQEHEHGHVSSNATAAAAWSMLHQGMALDELTIDPFTLTEVLRLHILSSGVKIGGNRNMWQTKEGFQFSDDPCVDFRHKEKSILTTLHTNCLYDLPIQDKLKILCVLCNQILTLTTTRDYIEDSFEKVKELKKKLRELQNAEQKRRKLDSAGRWRRKMEESARKKEEQEKKKKEKEARENESKADQGTSPAPTTSNKKRGRKSKSEEGKINATENKQQDNKIDQDLDMSTGIEGKKDDQPEEEKEEEHRKREEFKRQEQELLEEISKYSSIRSVAPLGLDRIYNRYWSFRHVDGLFVEADEKAKQLAENVGDKFDENEYDCSEDSQTKGIDDDFAETKQDSESRTVFPKVSLNEIIKLKNDGKPFCDTLFKKYRCKMDDQRRKLIPHSKVISTVIENVRKGMDPHVYAKKCRYPWSAYGATNEIDHLIDSLSPRGRREFRLKGKLDKISEKLGMAIGNCTLLTAVKEEDHGKTRQSKQEIDKSLFKSMEDFLEANLRDQLLEFEERLWLASLGIIKVDDREKWREQVGSRINELLSGCVENDDCGRKIVTEGDIDNAVEHKEPLQFSEDAEMRPAENGQSPKEDFPDKDKMEVDEGPNTNTKLDDSLGSEIGLDSTPVVLQDSAFKSLTLKFIEKNNPNKESSRCSTPVSISTPMINPRVKTLATALYQIERGIDPKYLKPPLGEDEETKRERIREMIEAAHADGTEKTDKPKRDDKKKAPSTKADLNGTDHVSEADDDKKSVTSNAPSEESLRKEITSLERWEASLNAATNFSQLFIHLNTLDRSVMWNKSVLNARCRICRKKGDAEKMLLCDGCDRGFHMYCLKPPVKKIPEGDWFCTDCRPKEPKRMQRSRRRPTKLEEFVDDIEEDAATEQTDEVEDAIESDEEEDDEESEDEPADEHEDHCAVCEEHGDLLCCDSCSRAFHLNCVYPPIRKVPRGDWSCQVCTGAELDLSKARRVTTKERQREKLKKLESKGNDSKTKKSTRGPSEKKRYSSPGPARSRRQRESSGKQENGSRPGAGSRRSIGDPTANSSRRKSENFGRYERRLCSKLVEELLAADDAEPFLLPVDTKVVPDYLDFIDHPMDLSTVKQNLNNGSYGSLQQFLDDVRLMFTNCETYNPPRSGVARAGSRLSIYFEQRLCELELVEV
ncbi:bromodomain adjacent to zinc finger domain protein 1A-like isoform X2 [Rhopilema esculentum]|uniref:bromodomain adjacent to zinc finger domain protein 1A-like isoform X2 n=1 Tax=Rhopilema esculentum TaxID=499914 RepID=UPI0031E3D6F1